VALKHVQKTYEDLGRKDPLYAVLSFREARGNQWDPDEFYARGRREIAAALDHLPGPGIEHSRGRALDFGCGAGRLTQALCDEFQEAVGVDISSSMIETARRYNRHGDRCRYLVNTTDDLTLLEDDSFDFVYSNITLQHIPPEASTRYIARFFGCCARAASRCSRFRAGHATNPERSGQGSIRPGAGHYAGSGSACEGNLRWKSTT